MTAGIDFLDPAFRADPYPTLARLRAEDPVHLDEYGIWILTRHRDIAALDRDPRLGRDYQIWRDYAVVRPFLAGSALEQLFESWLLSRDAPDHTRLRRLVSPAFSPHAIATMRQMVEDTADRLLDQVDGCDEVDFISAFADPFPIQVIATMMGLPPDSQVHLRRWSNALLEVLEPRRGAEAMKAADRAVHELTAYFAREISERRQQPRGDLISKLVAAHDDHDQLSDRELVAMLALLFFAGQVTTSNFIGTGILTLLKHPAQLGRWRADATLAHRAVEELLRYDGPTALSARIAIADVVVDGRRIMAGDMVLCLLGAANRDPQVFVAPDVLNLSRDPNPHVAFGGGPHYCLGAQLARIESQAAFVRVLDRWRDISLVEDGVVWRDSAAVRGLKRLSIRVRR